MIITTIIVIINLILHKLSVYVSAKVLIQKQVSECLWQIMKICWLSLFYGLKTYACKKKVNIIDFY